MSAPRNWESIELPAQPCLDGRPHIEFAKLLAGQLS